MKTGMTSVDVAALAAELAPVVVGSRVDRVYQPERDAILLRLRRKGLPRVDLLFRLGKFLTATRRPPANPDQPSMLAQVLRRDVENSRVTGFAQMGFDRLVKMELERGDGRRALVFELFGDGNLLLLDGTGTITLPMRGEDFGARSLRKGEPYLVPPGPPPPFGRPVAELRAAAEGKRDLVRFLSGDVGFGPAWAEELCLRSEVPKATPVTQVAPAQWEAVHAAIAALGRDIQRGDLAPALVHEVGAAGATTVDAVPFPMQRYPAPAFSHEEAASLHEALDAFFVGGPPADGEAEEDDPRRVRFEEARSRLQRQIAQMDEAIHALQAEEAEHRADAEAFYAAFPQAQSLLEGLQKARAEHPWHDVERTLAHARRDGNTAALQVPELRPHEGMATFALRLPDGTERRVAVDLRDTIQQNAETAFAAAKRARQRREGAEQARAGVLRQVADLEAKGLDAFGTAPARAERVSRHFWFESYRWTLTPSGLVAVGGRSASQNDAVVKKYLRDGDRYVHAEIHGAPSVVVRPAEGAVADIPNDDLRVACQFAACASRAWRQFAPASAYWVNASQVSKTPASGEYVPRGAWMIHGKRNVEPDLPMDWWVGLVRLRPDGTPVPVADPDPDRSFAKLVGGPKEGLRPFSSRLLHVVPGMMPPADAAQHIAAQFGVGNEEAAAVLPPGPVAILEG